MNIHWIPPLCSMAQSTNCAKPSRFQPERHPFIDLKRNIDCLVLIPTVSKKKKNARTLSQNKQTPSKLRRFTEPHPAAHRQFDRIEQLARVRETVDKLNKIDQIFCNLIWNQIEKEKTRQRKPLRSNTAQRNIHYPFLFSSSFVERTYFLEHTSKALPYESSSNTQQQPLALGYRSHKTYF